MLPNFSKKKTCVSYNNYHVMWCHLGAEAASGSARNYKLSESYEEMHMTFDLFVSHRKICPTPSVLIIYICLDSRTWPRIEFWPTSVFMTKWPSYLKTSCFSLILKQGINNLIKNHPVWKEGRDLKGKEKFIHIFLQFCGIPFSELFCSLHHESCQTIKHVQKADGAGLGEGLAYRL